MNNGNIDALVYLAGVYIIAFVNPKDAFEVTQNFFNLIYANENRKLWTPYISNASFSISTSNTVRTSGLDLGAFYVRTRRLFWIILFGIRQRLFCILGVFYGFKLMWWIVIRDHSGIMSILFAPFLVRWEW